MNRNNKKNDDDDDDNNIYVNLEVYAKEKQDS
jgi:hypothetical protein